MKVTRDIQSLSTFKRDTAKLIRQMKKTGQPVVLTVNGKALVVQDAESYQKLLDAKNRLEAMEGINRGLESMKRNAGKPAEKFFTEFFMARKPKRKRTSQERAAKKRRRKETMIIFINGKQRRVPKEPMIDGVSVEEFICRNADPVWLHQNEMWEYIIPADEEPSETGTFLSTTDNRTGAGVGLSAVAGRTFFALSLTP
jgi:prevent-host-death family protein